MNVAEKRMFSKKIVDSDEFITLPHTSQLYYYRLAMSCDDDGFCNHPRMVMLYSGIPETALPPLVEAGFVLAFDKVVVVRHWRIHNSLKSDRLRMPDYPEIAKQLWITPSGRYETEQPEEGMTLYDFKQAYVKTKRNPFGQDSGLQVH